EPLEAYLDGLGIGSGPARLEPIGEGHSNLTFLVEREGARVVLRRPPVGPLPPSAHDVVREARLLSALRPHGTPVPEVRGLGDPLADLGYMTTMWSEPGDPPNAVSDLSSVTREAGFPPRGFLTARYAERTGRSVDALPWYQILATWKAAIFLEGSFGRYSAGT